MRVPDCIADDGTITNLWHPTNRYAYRKYRENGCRRRSRCCKLKGERVHLLYVGHVHMSHRPLRGCGISFIFRGFMEYQGQHGIALRKRQPVHEWAVLNATMTGLPWGCLTFHGGSSPSPSTSSVIFSRVNGLFFWTWSQNKLTKLWIMPTTQSGAHPPLLNTLLSLLALRPDRAQTYPCKSYASSVAKDARAILKSKRSNLHVLFPRTDQLHSQATSPHTFISDSSRSRDNL